MLHFRSMIIETIRASNEYLSSIFARKGGATFGTSTKFYSTPTKLKCSINFLPLLLKFNKTSSLLTASMFMYSENEMGNYSFPGAQFLHRCRFRGCHRLLDTEKKEEAERVEIETPCRAERCRFVTKSIDMEWISNWMWWSGFCLLFHLLRPSL